MKAIKWNSKPITKPGLYSGIPLERYHSADICDGPSVSSSGLRLCFSKSPAHFYAKWPGNPNFAEDEDKPHFILGRALHHLTLGEANFQKQFCVQPDEYPDAKSGELKKWTYGAGYCKEWRLKMHKAGLSILTPSDVASIRGMATTLSTHPLVKLGVLNGMIEYSMFWKDKETGLWLKSRPDAIPDTSTDFVDLKTTLSVLWPDMQR